MNKEANRLLLSTQGADFSLKILAAIAVGVVVRRLNSIALRIFFPAQPMSREHRG